MIFSHIKKNIRSKYIQKGGNLLLNTRCHNVKLDIVSFQNKLILNYTHDIFAKKNKIVTCIHMYLSC